VEITQNKNKNKLSLKNPLYWVIAIAVVALLRWDEISIWFQ